MRISRFLPACLAVLSLVQLQPGWAQRSSIASRIHAPVDDSVRTKLKGNVSLSAQAQFDQGSADPSIELSHVRLLLSRTREQRAALDAYMAELQDSTSPNYHKWLTPERFGALYGPADSDISVLTEWLTSHGLRVESIAKGRTNIAFAGTVSQIEEAFHVSIHSFNRDGEQFFANTTEPQIPAALAPVILGIARMNTVRPRPHFVRGDLGMFNPETKRMEKAEAGKDGFVRPQLTTGSSSAGYFLYVVPGDAATIYDTPNSFNANHSSETSYTGTGVTIGIGGDATIKPTTVADYRTIFLGNSTQPTISYCTSSTACSASSVGTGITTDDTNEAYIDTELAGGLAPGAAIHYYASSDLFTAVEAAIDVDNTVDIFSLSFGACERAFSTSDNALVAGWWQQAAAQGITVTVSTGDNGSAGCDATTDSSGKAVTAASGGLAVSGLASTPYNIAVGGTDLSILTSNFADYASASGGSASTFYRTALHYIPENVWNDSTEGNTSLNLNVPWTAVPGQTSNASIVAASGGASSCSTNTTIDTSAAYTLGACNSGYAKPSWQVGSGVPVDGVRDIPDVSLMAGNGIGAAAWLICTDETGPESGVTVTANCTKQTNGSFYFEGFGGTSTAAPAFAGILALVKQSTGSRLGQAARNLYSLYLGPYYSSIFHDIEEGGNNSVPCVPGTPDCWTNAAGFNYLRGYDATTTYNLAIGMGSIDASGLIEYWNTTTGSTSPTMTIAASATTIRSSSQVTISGMVAGTNASGAPTGTIILNGGGYQSISQTVGSDGTYSFVILPQRLLVGADALTATYSGDANYAAKSVTVNVTVTGATPIVTAVPSQTNFAANVSINVAGVVSGSGGQPYGTVKVTGGGYASSATALDSTGAYTVSIPANSLSVGTDTLTATFSGDTSYSSATAVTSVTVTAPVVGSFALGAPATTTPASVAPGGSAIATIAISSPDGYMGTLKFVCAQSSGPTNAAADQPTCSFPTSAAAVGSTTQFSVKTSAKLLSGLAWPTPGGKGNGWAGAGGGALLALVVFLGIPARRRSWRGMVGMLLTLAALGSLAACGGGGGGGGGQKITDPGTAAGTYVFTVTGTGTPTPSTAPAAVTFTLVVN